MSDPSAGELAIFREYFPDLTDQKLAYVIKRYTVWPMFVPSSTMLPDMKLRQEAEILLRDRQLWEAQARASNWQ